MQTPIKIDKTSKTFQNSEATGKRSKRMQNEKERKS